MRIFKTRWAVEHTFLVPSVRYVGYRKDYYDGTFHKFGFWFWHFYVTDNPHIVYTTEEVDRHIAAWKAKHK